VRQTGHLESREARRAIYLLGGPWARPSVCAWGRAGARAPPATLFAALAAAAPLGAFALVGAATSTTTLPSVVCLTAP
jgi:hypothetical protein